MALLTFPVAPTAGQIYPVNPPAGVNIYQWDSADQTWRLLGVSTGVAAGVYGSSSSVPQITIDSAGRIDLVANVSIQTASTTQSGLVQLVDNTISNDPAKALTAAQGFKLQSEIGDVSLLNPAAVDLVAAINATAGTTGVTAGTYGNSSNVAQFTVNAQGRISAASNVPIALATTISPGLIIVGSNLTVTGTGLLSVPVSSTTAAGVVQIVNNTTTNDAAKALTAAAGYSLQQQIDAINLKNNLTFAGIVDGSTGLMTVVTAEGSLVGFVVGFPVPAASAGNDEYFVIVNSAGTFTPPGGAPVTCRTGDWLMSDSTQWVLYSFLYGSVTQVNSGTGLTGGPFTTSGTLSLLPASTTSLGGVIADGVTTKVSSSGVISSFNQYLYFDSLSPKFNGVTVGFTLSRSGVAYAPHPSTNIFVVLGGIPQRPGTDYTVSGSSITFTIAPPLNTSFLATTIG